MWKPDGDKLANVSSRPYSFFSLRTESSMLRGSWVSMKQSDDINGLPVVRLNPLSNE